MITYQELNSESPIGAKLYCRIDPDGISRLSCSEDDPSFQAWLAEGNEPLPAPELAPPIEPTPEEKLEAAGLSVNDLKSLLGLD